MEHEAGDDYLRRTAAFIRSHERNLAEAGVSRRRRIQKPNDATSIFNPLGWFGLEAAQASPITPLILSLDTHRLFYILMRLEALGIDVGTLDVTVDSPSRPMSFINRFAEDKTDSLSLSSIRSSFSAVSALSLGGGWWARAEPPSVEVELKYIYSSFTKLPALALTAPGRKAIKELENEPPNTNALPLDSFKNLQTLQCVDIDPRSLLGWDRVAESVRSLTIKRSGLEDVSDLFIGAVIDDQARREGSTSRKRQRRIPYGPTRQTSFYSTRLPDTVSEEDEIHTPTVDNPDSEHPEPSPSPPPPTTLSPLKWAFLKYLSLSDNALTFLPTSPLFSLSSLTHLDLSSNLLVSVPPGLSSLHNLTSLNLSDNMIDSVLGIYTNLGQIFAINLSRNRLESICGLERLLALERVDLRHNIIEDSAEVGRLATLPNIADIWVEGNPFVEYEEGYRITCFDFFWKEGKSVTLDGTPPGYYEKRNLTVPPPEQMSSTRRLSIASSPPVVAVTAPSHLPTLEPQEVSSGKPSPALLPVVSKGRKKKVKRIVELDGERSDESVRCGSHERERSDYGTSPRSPPDSVLLKSSALGDSEKSNVDPVGLSKSNVTVVSRSPAKPRHSRYRSEFIPTSDSSSAIPALQTTAPTPPSSSPGSPTRPRIPMRGSQTFSSRSAQRRARVSASVFEAPGGSDAESSGGGSGVEEYRKRIEALRNDMGDGWLKVFSQSQLGAGVAG